MADHQATPEDKLRALRARLNVAPRDHMLPDRQTAAIQIADIRWLVNFIDAALFEKDGLEAFDVFAARAVGNFGALVDELRASHGDLWKKAAAVALSNGFDAAYPEKLEALRTTVQQQRKLAHG